MKFIRTTAIALVLASTGLSFAQRKAEITSPVSVRGELGYIAATQAKSLNTQDSELLGLSAKNFAESYVLENLSAAGTEDLRIKRVKIDELGSVHVRLDQYLHGLEVVGAELMVHSKAGSGQVFAINGNFAPDFNLPMPHMAMGSATAMENRLGELQIEGSASGRTELRYYHDSTTGRTNLTWMINVSGVENGQFFDNDVYVDVFTHEVVTRIANVHTAKSWKSYDGSAAYLNNFGGISGLPGTLQCTDNQSCSDASVQRAHTGASDVYDYYADKFGRDSLNDAGMTMISSPHVDDNWNNAAWYAGQMVYGDGDGSTFIDFTYSYDVIAHELTHGVTDFESDLLYEKESGALNEAFSDIFGVSADSHARGGIVDASTWKLGEEIYTPGTNGDALRYMDNPTQDGYSTDYYPTRLYSGSCTPSSSNDSCGVHGNSGIANLAYQLLVEGGSHPRGVTSTVVPALGMATAEQIFYHAQVNCLTSGSGFQAARDCTSQAATALYGATEEAAVQATWDAVGAPGGPPVPAVVLANGVPETNLSAGTGSELEFEMNVPAGATDLSFQISGGSGDADLYTRFGSKPTTSTYDCRPYANGNSETCSYASPSAGTYYVMIRAYSSFSSVSLVGSYTGGGPNQAPTAGFNHASNELTADFTDTSSDSDGSIASRSWDFGDGGNSSATNPSHTYASGGTYLVTLTVTDDDGDSDSTSANVTVTDPPPNVGPTAGFSSSMNYLSGSFTDGSSDSDGTIASRSWNFGDGGSSSATNPSHTYQAAGSYTVTLTVTDDDGATDTASATVTATDPPAVSDMHVSSIVLSSRKAGKNRYPRALVTIVDSNGDPVSGATVSGSFGGAYFSGSDSATTGANGTVILEGNPERRNRNFSFCVDNVSGSLNYDSAANNETCDNYIK